VLALPSIERFTTIGPSSIHLSRVPKSPGGWTRAEWVGAGEVSRKGLPAALLMGVVPGRCARQFVTGEPSAMSGAGTTEHLLCMKTARERFVSLFWCYFDRPHPCSGMSTPGICLIAVARPRTGSRT